MVHVNKLLEDVKITRIVIYWCPLISNSAGSLLLSDLIIVS